MHQDPLEKRILRTERYIDALRHHVYITDQILLQLASEVADLKCETPENNDTCKRLAAEMESLKTLRNLAK